MAVQKVPLEMVQKLQQGIRTLLAVPDFENHPKTPASYTSEDDLPEPQSLSELGSLFNFGGAVAEATYAPNLHGEWFISTINPGTALLKLSNLWLKPEVRLVSYLHREGKDGIGVTWAVPEELSTTAQLERALANQLPVTTPPQPDGALPDLMDAIEGDRSLASFLVASILQRELRELGALGKFCNWQQHRLIQSLPSQVKWQWRTEVAKDLTPKVQIQSNGKAVVEFFTCRVVPPVAIFQHVDQYAADSYRVTSVNRPVAIAVKA